MVRSFFLRICATTASLLMSAQHDAFAGEIVIDGVAAMVDDSFIMVSDVMGLAQYQRQSMRKETSGAQHDRALARILYDDALKVLIEKQLVLNAYKKQAKEEKKEIPRQVINDRLDGMMRDMSGGDKAGFIALLEKDGIGYEEWRKEMEEQIIVSQMRRATVEQNVRISPQAAREYYEKNVDKFRTPAGIRLRMIVVKAGSDLATARSKAEGILARLKNGEDFGEIAKQVSEGDKADDGGDWGWIDPKILRKELAVALSDLEAGKISGIIETEDEFYVAKCEGRETESVTPFEKAQPQVEKELRQAEAKRLYDAWMERLKQSASIRVMEPRLF